MQEHGLRVFGRVVLGKKVIKFNLNAVLGLK